MKLRYVFRRGLAAALLLLALACTASDLAQPRAGLHTGGQPTLQQIDALAAQGVRTVIDLRGDDEVRGYDEAAELQRRGIAYKRLPIRGKDDLSADNAATLKALLDESGDGVLLHCASGNRVGALLALMAQQEEDATPQQALELGKRAGLGSLQPTVETKLGLAPAAASKTQP